MACETTQQFRIPYRCRTNYRMRDQPNEQWAVLLIREGQKLIRPHPHVRESGMLPERLPT
jgi:hypothetical protein